MLDLRTKLFRDYSEPAAKGVPTIVDTPYAERTAMIAHFQKGQSLIQMLLANGLNRIFLTDWKSATEDMKDLGIDEYLAEINVLVDGLGGRMTSSACAKAAGCRPCTPHDFLIRLLPWYLQAHQSIPMPATALSSTYPTAFYEGLISTGGGLMQGKIMLRCWKGIHPTQHYIQEHIDLYEHIDDPIYLQKEETFGNWYENPTDLPGRFYLQTIVRLFKENRLAKGTFVGLGRRRELKNITCPVYLLAGGSDDITTTEQVLDAEKYLGTPKNMIEKAVIPGGGVGLFMGFRTLRNAWPAVARWIANH